MTFVTKVVDATGLLCPLPVLRARKALGKISEGDVLEITVTDKNAPADFEAFCGETGHELLNLMEDGDGHRISIRKRIDNDKKRT